MDKINYEQEVKKVYPDAYYHRDCGGYVTHEIWIPPTKAKRISAMENSEQDAWRSAYNTITNHQNQAK